MKRAILAGLCIFLTGLIFAEGRNDSGIVGGNVSLRVAWWGADLRHQKTLDVIKLYETSHPGITISPEYSGIDSYFEKLNVQIAGGTAPDIFQLGGNNDYAVMGATLELEEYRKTVMPLPNFDEDILEVSSMNGHLYGVSLGANTNAYVYNKSILERAGLPMPPQIMTWDEFRSYCLSIVSKLPAGVWPLNDDGATEANTWFSYYMRDNGTPLHRDGTTYVKPADVQKWLELWESYRSDRIIPDPETAVSFATNDLASSALVKGRVVMAYIPSNQFMAYQSLMTDELDLIQLPNTASKTGWFQPSQIFSVYKNTAHPEEAAAFVNFFVTDLAAGRILGNERGIPSSQDVRDELEKSAGIEDRKIFQFFSFKSSYTTPMDAQLPNSREWISTFQLYYQQSIFDQITRTQAAEGIYDLILRLLAK